jgi:hypothetical protein
MGCVTFLLWGSFGADMVASGLQEMWYDVPQKNFLNKAHRRDSKQLV